MATARLEYLTIRAFQSYLDEATFRFPEKGLVLFRAKNHDTGGSSAAGKSTPARAVGVALDFPGVPALTELQNWDTEDQLSVKLGIVTDAGPIVISKGAKNSLKIGSDKAITGAKAIGEKLEALTGLSPGMLAALTYRQQAKPGRFLSKTNAEKQAFLALLLNLEPFEVALEVSAKKQKELQAEVSIHTGKLTALALDVERANAALGAVPLAIGLSALELQAQRLQEESKRLQLDVTTKEEALAVLQHRHHEGRCKLSANLSADIEQEKAKTPVQGGGEQVARLQLMVEQVRERLYAAKVADEDRRKAHDQGRATARDRVALAKTGLVTRTRLEQDLKALDKQLASLSASICPTCERTWEESQLKFMEAAAKRVEVVNQLAPLQGVDERVARLEQEAQAIGPFVADPVVSQIEAAGGQVMNALATEEARVASAAQLAIAQQRAAVAEVMNRVAAEQQKFDEEWKAPIAVATQEFNEVSAAANKTVLLLKDVTHSLEMFRLENATAEREQVRAQGAKKLAEETFAACQREQATVVTQELAEQDFTRLVGRDGFLGAIFDEVLAEISEETNSRLARMPNTQDVSLAFLSEVQSQKGLVRKEIRTVVSVRGHQGSLDVACSGGMGTAVNLAADLAVAAVIARRTGANPQWMILDECFEYLDTITREACMELLADEAQRKLILVIDHSSEFKEMFTQFVDIEYRDGKSWLKAAP